MKINFVVAAAALISTLLGSSAVYAQEVSCSGSGGTNCSGTIPDFPISTPFTSTLNLAQPFSGTSCNGQIAGVGVRVNLVHDHVGDLRITVAGPGGTATLIDQPAGTAGTCAGEDINAVFGSFGGGSCRETTIPAFTGDILAVSGLAALQTLNVVGTWTLTVTDLSNGFEGFVQDWALVQQQQCARTIPTQSTTGLLVMILLVFAMGAWSLAYGGRRRRRG